MRANEGWDNRVRPENNSKPIDLNYTDAKSKTETFAKEWGSFGKVCKLNRLGLLINYVC